MWILSLFSIVPRSTLLHPLLVTLLSLIGSLISLFPAPQACPYFAIRGIKEEAEIVFCPYNYLIDPLIREQVARQRGVRTVSEE